MWHALVAERPLAQVTASRAKLSERVCVCVQLSLVSIISCWVSFSLSPGMAPGSPVTVRPVLELRGRQICQTALRVSSPVLHSNSTPESIISI